MNAGTQNTRLSMTGMWGQTALLEGLRDPANAGAWTHLVERYRPRLVRLGARMGLGTADAEDAAQVALMEFVRSLDTFERQKGTLRQWLFGIARRQACNARRRRPRERVHGRDPRTTLYFDRIPGEPTPASSRSQELAALEQALERVAREVSVQTMEAFRMFALQGLPASVVAAELGMTENAVSGAKRRVLERVRELVNPTAERGA
jgi:RNA polymerase sigma factor (sigma-70 family)